MTYGEPVAHPQCIIDLFDPRLRYDGWSARTHQNVVLRVKEEEQTKLLKAPTDTSLEALARHEQRWLARLHDLPGVPKLSRAYTITPHAFGDDIFSTATLREYIEGEEFHARRRTEETYGALIELGHRMYGAGLLLPDDFDGRQIIVDAMDQPHLIDLEETREVHDESMRGLISEKIAFLRRMNVRHDHERTFAQSAYGTIRRNAKPLAQFISRFYI
jgi:hypothetical protein